MAEQGAGFLRNLVTSVSKIGQENNQFRQAAAQQNNSISKFIRDISKVFTNQSKSQGDISESLNNLSQSSLSTSQKVDQTNSLMTQSITIQTQMNNELKKMSGLMSKLLDKTDDGQGISNQNDAPGFTSKVWGALKNNLGLIMGAGAGAGLLGAGAVFEGGFDDFKNNIGSMLKNSAESVNIQGSTEQVLQAIKAVESGGDYGTPNKAGASSASGAYQFIDSTWQNLTKKYGIGAEYSRAMYAPPQVQDAVAAKYVEEILSQNNNDVSKIPLVWYTGNPRGEMSQKALNSNKGQQASAYQQKFLNAYSKITGQEKDDASAPEGTIVEKGAATSNSYGGKVHEKQAELAGVRKLPLSDRLRSVLDQAAASVGVEAVVYSGGQAPKGSGGPRTGSTRHDHGNAADLYLMKDGRKLSDTNPEDRAIMAKFVSAAVQAGATGVGAGHGYMGPSNIHVGFGKQATWGGASWIKSAAAGIYNNQDTSSDSGSSYAGGGQTGGSSGGGYAGGGQSFTGVPSIDGMLGGLMQSFGGMGMGMGIGGMGGGGIIQAALGTLAGGIPMFTQLLAGITGSSGGSVVAGGEEKENNIMEADDSFAKQSTIEQINTAAVERDLMSFAPQNTVQQQPPATVAGAAAPKATFIDRTGSRLASSSTWAERLSGNINYNRHMKLWPDVLA